MSAQHDQALDRLAVLLAVTPGYEPSPTVRARLREELEVRSFWPPVQFQRTPTVGGGWVRLAGFGVGVQLRRRLFLLEVRRGRVGGVDLGRWRLRFLRPDLSALRTAFWFVVRGEL